jgi:hypothetical protein
MTDALQPGESRDEERDEEADEEAGDDGFFVYVEIPEALDPFSRGEYYEDPLSDALEAAGLGEVTGGGTAFSDDRGISSVGIDVDLTEWDRGLALVRETLERCGVPRGTRLFFPRDGEEQIWEIGTWEPVTIYLDRAGRENLGDDPALRDFGQRLGAALAAAEAGEIRGSSATDAEIIANLTGPDPNRLYATIEPLLTADPLCRNARVVLGVGDDERGIRLP